MDNSGTATYKKYVSEETHSSIMIIDKMLIPQNYTTSEQRIAFTLDDGTVLDYSNEPATKTSWLYTLPFVICIFVAIYLLLSGICGAMDGNFPNQSGTSILARTEQVSPTYQLMYWLTKPRQETNPYGLP